MQRVAIIDRCITERAVAEDRLGGEFAICWGDLGKLDRARFDKELAALKLNEHGRVMAVATFGEAKVRADRYVAKYKKLAAKDPSWKRLLDAAQAGWDGWYKLREQHRATYDVIDAFREKLATGSKQEVAGCDPPLRKLLFAQMASKKPASIDDTNAAAKESPGYDIAVALRRCYSAQGKALEAATLHEIFFTRGTRDRRGPRSGSYYATLDALNAIREDRESFALSKLPYLPTGKDEKIHTPGEVATNQVEHGVAQGQIAKVSRGKVTTTVSFKTVRWRDPTYDCTQSNRIERFDDHGTAIYQQDCKLTGYENKTSTEAPVDVPTEFADGLKPGQMAILHLDTRNKKRAGIPVGVFADANKKKLLGLFGVFW